MSLQVTDYTDESGNLVTQEPDGCGTVILYTVVTGLLMTGLIALVIFVFMTINNA
jgi:tetrahydromethanopterin S-methyltransferase subunit B